MDAAAAAASPPPESGEAAYRKRKRNGTPEPPRKRFVVHKLRPPKAHPVNELKKRLRSVRRQLAADDSRDTLRADVRLAKERALAALQQELDEAARAEHLKKMIARYHKVRFFERQKARRRLKQVQKQEKIEGDSADALHVAEVDLAYTTYYPLDEAYVSLFAAEGTEEAQREDSQPGPDDGAGRVTRQDNARWQHISQLLREPDAATRLAALRHGGHAPVKNMVDRDADVAEARAAKAKPAPKLASKPTPKAKTNGPGQNHARDAKPPGGQPNAIAHNGQNGHAEAGPARDAAAPPAPAPTNRRARRELERQLAKQRQKSGQAGSAGQPGQAGRPASPSPPGSDDGTGFFE